MSALFRTASRLAALGALGMLLLPSQGCICIPELGCGGNSQTAAPTITLTASTLAPEVVPDGSIQVTLTGSFAGGPTRAVLAVGGQLPTGIRVTFAPTEVRDGVNSVMTISADDKAQVGKFVFDVVATESGTTGGATSTTQFTAETK